MSDILNTKTDKELLLSCLAEIAKSKNELTSAEADLRKVKNRINFLIVLTNKLLDRQEK